MRVDDGASRLLGEQWLVGAAMIVIAVHVALDGCRSPTLVTDTGPDGAKQVVAAEPTSTAGVQAVTGEYVLLRRLARGGHEPIQFAAIKLGSPRSDGSVEYDCVYPENGKPNLALAPRTKGKVQERLTRTPTRGVFSTANSALDITCGSFRMMWSAGNWIYFFATGDRLPSSSRFDMALSGRTALEELDPFDQRLRWLSFV